ncbi:MAG: HEAT repeat domain-containing protein [Treponemataceae bacterium]|nr:HEAT repeat domain-containing protein [Treponemataceae bacterium]
MKNSKILSILLCLLLVCSFGFAQGRTETTVEEEYLSTVEDIIIQELTAAPDRDSKLVALQYLESAIAGGRASPDMAVALDSLAGEGIYNESRTDGRIANNYPDIRKKACDLLGEIKTEESKNSLMKVALADNEPMVTTAAIRALGNVGINENDEVVNTIAWAQKKFARINPTSSLALEVLNAYEKLAPTVKDNSDMVRSISEIAVNYNYVTPVRQKALQLLKTLTGR